MTPPFKYVNQPNSMFFIIDDEGDVIAENVRESTARLIVGLLNGHFHVPVVFHAEPIKELEIKQV